MGKKDINTEQAILEAAEQEFLDKGCARAKTTEIAKRAGVNHAMLHYYFRTKENLFNVVFEQKVQELASSLSATFATDLPFLERVKQGVEKHFDFITTNPKLPFFVYNEIICNEERKSMLLNKILPKINLLISQLEEEIKIEVRKGAIAPICAQDLIFNIVSLNLFSVLVKPLINLLAEEDGYRDFLQHRRKNNIQVILKSLQV